MQEEEALGIFITGGVILIGLIGMYCLFAAVDMLDMPPAFRLAGIIGLFIGLLWSLLSNLKVLFSLGANPSYGT